MAELERGPDVGWDHLEQCDETIDVRREVRRRLEQDGAEVIA